MLVKNNKGQLKREEEDVYGDSWFPRHIIVGLSAAIEAERQAPRRKDVIKILREVCATGKFDEADPLQVGLLEPNFFDRDSRTPERVRERADRHLKDYLQQRPGKHGRGSGRYIVRPDGIGAPTLCALMVSVKLGWPALKTRQNRQAYELCQKLWTEAGGDVRRRGGTPHRTDGHWRDHLRGGAAAMARHSNRASHPILSVDCLLQGFGFYFTPFANFPFSEMNASRCAGRRHA